MTFHTSLLFRVGFWIGLLSIFFPLSMEAHVGNPHVVFEGKAGAMPIRVVVRQPDVVPGLAEISVQVLEGTPSRVTALPLHWNVARKGAPAADVARLLPGETNLYQAQLWLMTSGAYGVEVSLEGERGGSVIVPVNSVAYQRKAMPMVLKIISAFLGFVLAVGVIAISVAGSRDGHRPSGEERVLSGQSRGVVGAVVGLGVVAVAVLGGYRWWDAEDEAHRTRVLFKPVEHRVAVHQTPEGSRIQLEFTDPRMRQSSFAFAEDHGKWLHLFLIGASSNQIFAHLHPTRSGPQSFQSLVPALPEGVYRLFVDLTHESGLTETLTNAVRIANNVSSSPVDSDPDDSFSNVALSSADVVDLGPGIRMNLKASTMLKTGRPEVLEVFVEDEQGRAVALQPYLRMLGHAVVERVDGSVFSHVHPAGTLSMAAARGFAKRTGGDVAVKDVDAVCGDLSAMPEAQALALGLGGRVGFPFVFPVDGDYAIWIQVKVKSQILTGAFRRTVH